MKEPFIKSINISVTTKDGKTLIKFMKPEKIRDILEDDKTTIADFLKSIIANEAL